jgi:hypothetical protein
VVDHAKPGGFLHGLTLDMKISYSWLDFERAGFQVKHETTGSFIRIKHYACFALPMLSFRVGRICLWPLWHPLAKEVYFGTPVQWITKEILYREMDASSFADKQVIIKDVVLYP